MESLGFEVKLAQPFDQAIDTVTAALKTQGFGVLTRIDVKATLKEKLGVDFRPYTILGACNPSLAHLALVTDAWIGLLLPCNVTVESFSERECLVRLTDPAAMVNLSEKAADMVELAKSGHNKMQAVVETLQSA